MIVDFRLVVLLSLAAAVATAVAAAVFRFLYVCAAA